MKARYSVPLVLLAASLALASWEGAWSLAPTLLWRLLALYAAAAAALSAAWIWFWDFRSRRKWFSPASILCLAFFLGLQALALSPLRGEASAEGSTPSLSPESAMADRPDLVLFTVDTVRGDRWQAVSEIQSWPLEQEAVSFAEAFSPVGLTAPSHASLWTGNYPHQHGVRNNGGRLTEVATLAQRLAEAGYFCMAVPSMICLDRAFGFDHGFHRFASLEPTWSAGLRRFRDFRLARAWLRCLPSGMQAVRSADRSLALAEAWWRQAGSEQPRFLWVHLFDAHWPYQPSSQALQAVEALQPWPEVATPGFQDREVHAWRVAYDAELWDLRRRLIAFQQRLRGPPGTEARNLWTVLVGDHGEGLGEHGVADHGDLLYQEQLRVPFWIHGPKVQPSAAPPPPISLIDLFPTLAELLDLTVPNCAGRSFAPWFRTGTMPSRPVFAETGHAHFDNCMVLAGGRKLILHHWADAKVLAHESRPRPSSDPDPDLPWRKPWEAYDLAEDPQENRPISNLESEPWPSLRDALQRWQQQRMGRPKSGLQAWLPDERDALRELGY
ncbi:MAG: hypothetical protein DWQ01_03125 [Planctomycetota bacterium]|nr:MAG: hypothetical protein DWQ01_03125 [Planctomycetota bacterium]